jgi:transcription antitermination protein NusB
MPSGRRSARRQAVVILYQQDLLRLSADEAIERAEQVDEYSERLVRGVDDRRDDIDAALGKHLEGWSLGRLGVLERAILRVAGYELLWEPEVPPAVVIDEAVGSAKRFCSDEAGSLVNGVLGSLAASARVQGAEA